jgi:hypothetical protein
MSVAGLAKAVLSSVAKRTARRLAIAVVALASILVVPNSAPAADCKPTISASGEQNISRLWHLYRGKPIEVASQGARARAKDKAWTAWSSLVERLYGRSYAFDGNAGDARTSCSEIPAGATNWFEKSWQCRVWGKPCNG